MSDAPMTLPDELPLFPLNAVLFPGMPLPLHIFEERYKRLLARCLSERSPFGVALIRHGQEVGAPAEPHAVGTSAVVTGVESLPAGDYNISTLGCDRFRIDEIVRREPYLVARVRPFPLVTDLPAESALPGALQADLDRYVESLARAVKQQRAPACAPSDPSTLAYLAGIVLQLPPAEKQTLLAIESLAQLLAAESALLRRELQLMEFMRTANPCPVVTGRHLAN